VAAADTAALYMAAHDAEVVRDELLRAGLRPETPVIVAESLTLAGEQTGSGFLKDLPALVSGTNAGPVLLLLGEVFAQEAAAGVLSARTASQAA
jgi:siroheme synthase